MKVIFLDVDGVLNNICDIHDEESLNDTYIERLAKLVNKTNAKIVLTSTWRLFPQTMKQIMDHFNRFELTMYSITDNGIPFDKFNNTKWANVKPCPRYVDFTHPEICNDRGAEIAAWILDCPNFIESFVIIDDEIDDIKNYFDAESLVHVDFHNALTNADCAAAAKKLGC